MALIVLLLAAISLFGVTDGILQQEFAFVVDCSPKSDNGTASWPSMVNYVYAVIQKINLINCCDEPRSALIRYSDDAFLQFGFDPFRTLLSMLVSINRTAYRPGNSSNLAGAIDFARKQVFTPRVGMLWYPWHVMIVVTDNLPSTAYDDRLRTAVYKAKVSGIQIVTVAVGNNMSVDQNVVLQISSKIQMKNFVVTVSNYSALEDDSNVVAAANLAYYSTQLSGSPSTECFAMYAEVVFLLDSSTKSQPSQFVNMRDMAELIAFNFAYVDASFVRFALVRYDTTPSIQFYLNWDGVFISSTNNRIKQVSYSGGGASNLSLALDLVRTDVFSSDVVRPGVPKIAIIITDNLRVSDNRTLLAAVNDLKATNVRVVAIGVNFNNQVDFHLLHELGQNDETYSDTITVSDHSQLGANILSAVMSSACVIQPSPPDNTTTATDSTSKTDLDAVISRQNSFLIAIVVIVATVTVILVLIGILVIRLTLYIVRGQKNEAETSTENKPSDKHQTYTPNQAYYEEHIYDSEYNDCT